MDASQTLLATKKIQMFIRLWLKANQSFLPQSSDWLRRAEAVFWSLQKAETLPLRSQGEDKTWRQKKQTA